MPQAIRVIDQIGEIQIDRTVVVGQLGNGNYTTIKDACDYVATQSPAQTTPWQIFVLPGRYDESPFTIPDYTTVVGWYSGYYNNCAVTIRFDPTAGGNMITMGNGSILQWCSVAFSNFFPVADTNMIFADSSGYSHLIGVYISALVLTASDYAVIRTSNTQFSSINMTLCDLQGYNIGAGAGRIIYNDGDTSVVNAFYTKFTINANNAIEVNDANSDINLYSCGFKNSASKIELTQTAGTISLYNTPYTKSSGTITNYDLAATTYPGTVLKAAHIADADGTLAGVTAQFNALLDSLEAAGTLATS